MVPGSSVFEMDAEMLTEMVNDASKQAGLTEVTPAVLSATWVFNAVRNGEDYSDVQKQVGGSVRDMARLIEMCIEIDEKDQPSVMIYMPVQADNLLTIEATLISLESLDYANYVVILGCAPAPENIAAYISTIAKEHKAVISPTKDQSPYAEGLRFIRDTHFDYFLFILPGYLTKPAARLKWLLNISGTHDIRPWERSWAPTRTNAGP
jgi:hypothetical protein